MIETNSTARDQSHESFQVGDSLSLRHESAHQTSVISLLKSDHNERISQEKERMSVDRSESEHLQKRLDEAETELEHLRADTRRNKVLGALASAGALHPDLLVDRMPKEPSVDAEILNSAAFELRVQYPSLFRSTQGNGNGGEGGQRIAVDSMNDAIRRAAGRS